MDSITPNDRMTEWGGQINLNSLFDHTPSTSMFVIGKRNRKKDKKKYEGGCHESKLLT